MDACECDEVDVDTEGAMKGREEAAGVRVEMHADDWVYESDMEGEMMREGLRRGRRMT